MRIREAPKEVFASSAASISSYISSETIFAFLFSFPPIQFLRHVLASRESLPGDNINPGSPRWHLRPLVVSLANCLPAVLAKWRLRRAETRDCERVIKKSSRKTPAISLSFPRSLFLFLSHTRAQRYPSHRERRKYERYAILPLLVPPPPLYCFWDLQRAMVDSGV